MALKFRLEDASIPQGEGINSEIISVAKISLTPDSRPRCDSPGVPCYGCNSAELRKTQEDVYKNAAA